MIILEYWEIFGSSVLEYWEIFGSGGMLSAIYEQTLGIQENCNSLDSLHKEELCDVLHNF